MTCEIHLLLNKFYPPIYANQFFELVTHMAIIGDDENRDKTLAFLRKADQELVSYGNLFNVLFNARDLEPNLPQQISHREIQHKISPERYLHGKATLAAIEQLLSPYYLQEFVRDTVTCLTKEFDATGDLSSLNTAFENHMKNVQRHIRLN